jgi:hypothetical protein
MQGNIVMAKIGKMRGTSILGTERANSLISMKAPLFALGMAVFSSAACADWQQFAKYEDFTTYIDLQQMRRTGGRVKMWNLHDYSEIQIQPGRPHLSAKILNEYDCSEFQRRVLASYTFTGHMGGGVPVDIWTQPGSWSPIVPGTIGSDLIAVACK